MPTDPKEEVCEERGSGPHCDHARMTGSFSIGPAGSKSSTDYTCCWCGRHKHVEFEVPYTGPVQHGPYKPAGGL